MTRAEIISKGTSIIKDLGYEECLAVLNNCYNLPAEFITALANRTKEIKGTITFEVVVASMQATVNVK